MNTPTTFDYICFDLDGTLVDSAKGIVASLKEALAILGREDVPTSTLLPLIGITLRQVFAQFVSQNRVEEGVHLYRTIYSERHLLNVAPFPGIVSLLNRLRNADVDLFVVTAKLDEQAQRVIAHLDLAPLFCGVHGVDAAGTLDDKSILLRQVKDRHSLHSCRGLMIGDRAKDIIAGNQNGLATIGVTYGYGTEIELKSAKPLALCRRSEELGNVIAKIQG